MQVFSKTPGLIAVELDQNGVLRASSQAMSLIGTPDPRTQAQYKLTLKKNGQRIDHCSGDWEQTNQHILSLGKDGGAATGADVDNGSTKEMLNYILPEVDFVAGSIYSLELKISGHVESTVKVSLNGQEFFAAQASDGAGSMFLSINDFSAGVGG